MGASIVLTGLGANYWLPNIYVETNFAQGPATGSGAARAILVLANRTTSGTATVDTTIYGPDTQVPLQSEADMIALGGPGSEAHRLFRRIAAVNKVTPVYWLFVTESAGAQATGTIAFANNATGTGNVRVWVGDEYVDTTFASGQTPTAIGDAVVLSVNARTHWPVTASNLTGTVTLTAKQKGLRGNWIRFMAAITSGVGTTATASTDAFLAGGTTADTNATALTTIAARHFYQIVSAAEDAVQFGALNSQVATQALPAGDNRQRIFAGSVDTLGNTATIVTGVNSPRAEVIWHEKSPFTPAELAAYLCAIYAREESNDDNPRTNFIGYGNGPNDTWSVPPSRVASAAPTATNLNIAGGEGITPIAVTSTGTRTYLVDRITTRSLNGATPDYRIRDAHKVTICDRFADKLQAKLALQNAGKRIGDDPPKGGRPPGPLVVTPQIVRMQVFKVIDDFDSNDLLQDPDTIKAGTVVQREANPTSRMGIRVPLATINNFRQGAVAIDQVL
jgi:phage tail sheath gpL-like